MRQCHTPAQGWLTAMQPDLAKFSRSSWARRICHLVARGKGEPHPSDPAEMMRFAPSSSMTTLTNPAWQGLPLGRCTLNLISEPLHISRLPCSVPHSTYSACSHRVEHANDGGVTPVLMSQDLCGTDSSICSAVGNCPVPVTVPQHHKRRASCDGPGLETDADLPCHQAARHSPAHHSAPHCQSVQCLPAAWVL